MELNTLTCPQLIALCRDRQIKGYSGKKKTQLLELLTGSSSCSSNVPVEVPEGSITFIEVCAGAGGLMKAGFLPVFLNEIDRDCCRPSEILFG